MDLKWHLLIFVLSLLNGHLALAVKKHPETISREQRIHETHSHFQPSASFGLTYYVSGSNGNDDNNGTIDAPFATLLGARNAIRKLSSLPSGGILVYIREGTYYNSIEGDYSTPLLPLYYEDSGTSEAPIVYSGYPNEEVLLSGGIPINSSYFETSTDHPGFLVADLTKIDANWANVDLGKLQNGELADCVGQKSELFVNNERMWLAR